MCIEHTILKEVLSDRPDMCEIGLVVDIAMDIKLINDMVTPTPTTTTTPNPSLLPHHKPKVNPNHRLSNPRRQA